MMAERIALTHHERWDGRGYPERTGRRGDSAAGKDRHRRRRVRRAHHRRPYKEPWPVHVAVREILSEAGTSSTPA